MLTIRQEDSLLTEINAGSGLKAVAFAANGEYIVSGGSKGVRLWGVKDGKQVATLEANYVWCLTVSRDGQWIAAGICGKVIVWDTRTHEKVFSCREDYRNINGVDFSPDLSRLVSASENRTATIWDIATRKRVQTLRHDDWVRAAKYSPQGDRIATATPDFVRVWDSNDGRSLADIKVSFTTWNNTGLLWLDHHLFILADNSNHPQGQPSRNGQLPMPTRTRASLYQSMRNSSFAQHGAPSHFATRRHTLSSVSSNIPETSVHSHSHQTIGFSQLVERTGTSLSIVCPTSL